MDVRPKIVLAPMNVANMPGLIVKELKRRGYDAEQVQYSFGKGHKFGYELDREINIKELGGRIKAHALTTRDYLERDFDIFHFWNKSFFFEGKYKHLTGFDIPLIKARNKRVAYRFTGFDLRLPKWDMQVNPYSPFRYGYEAPFEPETQEYYLDFLKEYVDQFLVQDPELGQFSPGKPRTIPRALNLDNWDFVGVKKTDKPLVVHAPSNSVYKGSKFVLQAVSDLQDEGLSFEFKAIQDMSHSEAISWYKKADIIVDQLLIGSTGVLTLEAWALGKPCVVYLREDLFKPFYETSELPVANANPDNITSVLRKVITDYEWREDLSKRGRATVEKYHDINKVIGQFVDLYSDMMGRTPIKPSSYGDIEYLRFQAEMSQKSALVANVKSRKLNDERLLLKKIHNNPEEWLFNLNNTQKEKFVDRVMGKTKFGPFENFIRKRILQSIQDTDVS